MSAQVSRDKYDRLKKKAEKWQSLALEYKESMGNLQEEFDKRLEDATKQVIDDLNQQVDKWKKKAEDDTEYKTNFRDVSESYKKLCDEMKDIKAIHKEKIKEMEEKHKDQLRELKYESREKIADLRSDIRLKEGEIQNEKRIASENVKYWKEMYEDEVRKSRRHGVSHQ